MGDGGPQSETPELVTHARRALEVKQLRHCILDQFPSCVSAPRRDTLYVPAVPVLIEYRLVRLRYDFWPDLARFTS